ncbi:hypothetical protein H4R26_001432 [Coemansia thaxteri]|uniref:Pre-mRNA-processing factor 17 n=1 Tax=Coemansia thaxteri TaxID=2663907 RepID=A0A9W8EGL8_9FUNG|nr:hypothetical protein H4R26_001432 [Coemansia thaxteri]
MDVLNQYGSDSESDGGQPQTCIKPVVRQYKVDTAPDISAHAPSVHELGAYLGPGQREIRHNMAYQVLAQPVVGPVDSEGDFGGRRERGSGLAEIHAVNEAAFRRQERMFREQKPSETTTGGKNNRGLRRKAAGQAAVLDGDGAYQGPWAGYEGETRGQAAGPSAEQVAEHERRVAQHAGGSQGAGAAAPRARAAYAEGQAERTTFHGASERDYQGRTYMHVAGPSGAAATCFAPKRLVKEWRGAHAGGVSAIRLMPGSGHLLLSSGMDGLVKIFDTQGSLSLLRTFTGHSKAVRDVSFAPDGTTFLSSSYDTYTKLWDTETGACRQRFSAKGRVPYVARFHPEDPNVFLVGQGDKRIVQWDVRANEIVQEYNQHLGAINSLTFFDSNRRFVSTSDDKTMRVWEFGFPVVIKLVADPSMHSVPAVALHPSEKWFVGQSMDNRLVVYSAGERIKPHKRKEFSGHLTAGFACQPSFSPDGRFLTSGDSEGSVWCWDWQTTRLVTKWKAHDKVAICSAWHPRESSRVATCSWDGSIKYWD